MITLTTRELQQALNRGVEKITTRSAGHELMGLTITVKGGQQIFIDTGEDASDELRALGTMQAREI